MNGTGVRVSVVIPVFNAGPLLEQALRSVETQTYRDHEVVLVDDGSTDHATLALLEAAAGRPGMRLCRTPNGGPAAARNLGIEHARGAYIVPLDADDYLAPAFLAKTVAVLDSRPEVGVAYTWVELVGDRSGIWETHGLVLPELLTTNTLHVTALYRRQLWVDVGGYDSRFADTAEDWDFWLGAAERGWTGHCVPEALACYRRTVQGREFRSRVPGASARFMRLLVQKHRALYETHLEEAIASMYERVATSGASLERIYDHPAVRTLAWLRGLTGPRRT